MNNLKKVEMSTHIPQLREADLNNHKKVEMSTNIPLLQEAAEDLSVETLSSELAINN